MEISFGRCVRCKHSMRNRVGALNFRWKQGGESDAPTVNLLMPLGTTCLSLSGLFTGYFVPVFFSY